MPSTASECLSFSSVILLHAQQFCSFGPLLSPGLSTSTGKRLTVTPTLTSLPIRSKPSSCLPPESARPPPRGAKGIGRQLFYATPVCLRHCLKRRARTTLCASRQLLLHRRPRLDDDFPPKRRTRTGSHLPSLSAPPFPSDPEEDSHWLEYYYRSWIARSLLRSTFFPLPVPPVKSEQQWETSGASRASGRCSTLGTKPDVRSPRIILFPLFSNCACLYGSLPLKRPSFVFCPR